MVFLKEIVNLFECGNEIEGVVTELPFLHMTKNSELALDTQLQRLLFHYHSSFFRS